MAKKQAKKRHIANSDTDSENSYPASQPTNSGSSTTTTTKTSYVPRFLIIHSEKGETISSLFPFVVHKTIMSIASITPYSSMNSKICSLLCLIKAGQRTIPLDVSKDL